ncbi:MAG: GNAT family N-acetyltransferase [Mesorhizobium sp.]|nr:GNAT family N-acetyltransferase [Mesorhizobium sp.]
MAAPPAHYPPLPHNRQLALLKARAMPAHFYRYLMDRIGRKWHWVNALRMSDAELAKKLGEPARDIRVLYLEGIPVGMFEVAPQPPDAVELVYFGLTEAATGQGLGRWFLGAAVEAAWSRNPKRVTVQTCTLDHPAALPLYQKMGFSPVAQVKETVHPLTLGERAAILVKP